MKNNKVYIVFRHWIDFEDYDSNAVEIEKVFDDFYSAKLYALGLVADEIEVEMTFKNEEDSKIKNILKSFDNFHYVEMIQQCGNGTSMIHIEEKEINYRGF